MYSKMQNKNKNTSTPDHCIKVKIELLEIHFASTKKRDQVLVHSIRSSIPYRIPRYSLSQLVVAMHYGKSVFCYSVDRIFKTHTEGRSQRKD